MHRIAIFPTAIIAAIATLTTVAPGAAAAPGAASRCPDVTVVAVPGTTETNPNADPHVPTGMLGKVVEPVKKAARPRRVSGLYVPYPADIIGGAADSFGYGFSRRKGIENASTAITAQARQCPRTRFLLTGYSQGAQVAGDLGAAIGAGQSPIPADKILGVALLADPAQAPQGEPTIGVTGSPVGFAGSRQGGFGALTDRVLAVCAPNDFYCNVPMQSPTIRLIGLLGSQLDAADPNGSARKVLSIAVGTFLAPASAVVEGLMAMMTQPNFVANLVTGGKRFIEALVQQAGVAAPVIEGIGAIAADIQAVVAAALSGAFVRIPALVATAIKTCTDMAANIKATAPAVADNAPAQPWVLAGSVTDTLQMDGMNNRRAVPQQSQQLFGALTAAANALMSALPLRQFPAMGGFYSLFSPQRVTTDLMAFAQFLQGGAHTSYDQAPLDPQGHTGVQLVSKWMTNQIAQVQH